MKLHCPDVLHILSQKPILMSNGMLAQNEVVPAGNKARKDALANLIPMIHKAEKFIFDSGQDTDPDTTQAIRDTAVAMMEAGLFHLPHPVIWVEDPFTSESTGEEDDFTRNFYLVTETATRITTRLLQRFDFGRKLGRPGVPMLPTLLLHQHPLIIELDQPTDKFLVETTHVDTATADTYAEAIYSVKKLLVALNSRNIEIERVAQPQQRAGIAGRRSYAHAIVRIPSGMASPADGSSADASADPSGEPGKRRRWHLVRGFIYGKNTRPLEQQRWVKPYWRGDKALGVVEHTHYEIGAPPPAALSVPPQPG